MRKETGQENRDRKGGDRGRRGDGVGEEGQERRNRRGGGR